MFRTTAHCAKNSGSLSCCRLSARSLCPGSSVMRYSRSLVSPSPPIANSTVFQVNRYVQIRSRAFQGRNGTRDANAERPSTSLVCPVARVPAWPTLAGPERTDGRQASRNAPRSVVGALEARTHSELRVRVPVAFWVSLRAVGGW